MNSPKAYVDAINRARESPELRHPDIAPGVMAIEDLEVTSDTTRMAETMMLGLRLREGVSMADFRRRFNLELRDIYKDEIADLRDLGLIEIAESRVRLTRRGRLLGNEVFQRFV